MTFTIEALEVFALILVRISTFVYTAPFFSQRSLPMKVKIGLSAVLSVVVFEALDIKEISYVGEIGYLAFVVEEAICALVLGLCNGHSIYYKMF